MPVIDGKVQRARFTSLKLKELSSVDNPAQPGARATFMKRAEPIEDHAAVLADVAKYICENDGAHTFSEVLAENKFSQDVWPCVDALSQSIRSIVGDASLAGGEREAAINASVNQFLAAVRDISPEVSKQLEPLLIRKREGQMPKTVEELQADLNKVSADLVAANERADTEKARADKAEKEATDAKEECKTAKAALVAATDETVKYGGEEIKKSEVGDGPFKIAKAAANDALTARLEKRAGSDFAHVVGTDTDKALVLGLVDGLDAEAPARKALEAILTSCEKMTAAGFDRRGGGGGEEPTNKAAVSTFDGKVTEIATRDKITKSAAMSKARVEFPAEFAAAYPDSVDLNDAVAN